MNKENKENKDYIPSKLPDGRLNPEWRKRYIARRKAAGNPIPQKTKEQWREYRKTTAGKAAVKKWHDSKKGKAANTRSLIKRKVATTNKETPEEYAGRIMGDLDRRGVDDLY